MMLSTHNNNKYTYSRHCFVFRMFFVEYLPELLPLITKQISENNHNTNIKQHANMTKRYSVLNKQLRCKNKLQKTTKVNKQTITTTGKENVIYNWTMIKVLTIKLFGGKRGERIGNRMDRIVRNIIIT